MIIVSVTILVLFIVILTYGLIYYFYLKKINEAALLKEKEVKGSLKTLREIESFLNWTYKLSDAEAKNLFINRTEMGMISQERLDSIKIIEDFIAFGDKLELVRSDLFLLPRNYYSEESLAAEERLKEIESIRSQVIVAFKENYVSPFESIFTFREGIKEYCELIKLPLNDMINLELEYKENDSLKKTLIGRKNLANIAEIYIGYLNILRY